MEKVKLFWSKSDNDWKFSYPDDQGKALMGVFFDMVKTTGHRTDWRQTLIAILSDQGYDPTTLQITCKKFK